MTDVLAHPRIRDLIDQAERAARLRADGSVPTDGYVDLDQTLDSIYRDLGRALFELARPAEGPPPLHDGGGAVPEAESDDNGGWYTDEVEIDTSGRLFDPEDLDDFTDVPYSTPAPASRTDDDDDDDDYEGAADDYDVVRLDALQARAADPDDGLFELADPGREAPTWAHRLAEFLDVLALPADLEDANELAVEATRVQWAAGELDSRLGGLPESVQLALVALLAARAQHLRHRLDVDVGPKMVLDRLRRYRLSVGLQPVTGLVAEPRSDTGSWAGDARALWSLLQVRAKPTE